MRALASKETSDGAPVLRSAIKNYLTRSGVEIVPTLEVDNFAMAMSLVTSTRGTALLPASIEGYLPSSITSRLLTGKRPTGDLMVEYHKTNTSPILKKFISRIEDT